MKLGFEFQQTMTGSYTRQGDGDAARRFVFTARMVAPNVFRHLRDGKAELQGTLDMEGFADDVPIQGVLHIAPIDRAVRYDFSFMGNDGEPYRFAGGLASLTTLTGVVRDRQGSEIARAQLRFNLKTDLLPLLVSFKPATAA